MKQIDRELDLLLHDTDMRGYLDKLHRKNRTRSRCRTHYAHVRRDERMPLKFAHHGGR